MQCKQTCCELSSYASISSCKMTIKFENPWPRYVFGPKSVTDRRKGFRRTMPKQYPPWNLLVKIKNSWLRIKHWDLLRTFPSSKHSACHWNMCVIPRVLYCLRTGSGNPHDVSASWSLSKSVKMRKPLIFSLEIFRTGIILLYAHPQVVYCKCIQFHHYWSIS